MTFKKIALAAALIGLAACASGDRASAPATVSADAQPAEPAITPPPMMVDMPAASAPMAAGLMRADAVRKLTPPPPQSEYRERYDDTNPNPVKAVAEAPVSTFSIDVDTASYANVRRYLVKGAAPPRDAVRIEELLNYFDYGYPSPPSRAEPFRPFIALAPSPWSAGKTILHIGLQGYDIAPSERPPLNLVLLADVSGSMQGDNRLPLAKQAMRLLVDQLEAKDRVALAVYAGAAGTVLEPTPGDQKSKILAAIDALEAGGSTAGGQGIALAYALAERNFDKSAVNRVMLATDGDFNVGVTNPAQLEDLVAAKRASGVYLSVLGFGGGNYNDALMQRLAQKGNGVAAYIDTLAEARKVLHDQVRAALLPIADDVKIQVEFNPAKVAEYRLIGYETRMLDRADFVNDRVDAGEVGAGASVTALYEVTPVGGKTVIEPLRYQTATARKTDSSSEIAFLRVRWKPPGAQNSKLMERPITPADAFLDLARAPEAMRFAVAVAGYGQLLRGDPYLDGDFGWQDVVTLAQGARGDDPFGWRAEFVQLARAAEGARPNMGGDVGAPGPAR